MPPEPFVRRVLGDRPFAEIGEPALALVHESSRLVAVGGDVGSVQWSGGAIATSRWTGHRIGVYERDGLRCRHLTRSRYPVRSLAFHPVLPLLAAGTGRYDGGFLFEGELLLIDTATGAVVSALSDAREVLGVEWLGATALRLVLAPTDDWDNRLAHRQGHVTVVDRPDWSAVGKGAIGSDELAAPAEPAARTDRGGEARALLTELAAATGRTWSVRRRVWAVEALEDGRALAALDGVRAESWLPSGERQWAVEDEVGGRQLLPAPDGTSLWTNAERGHLRAGRGEHPSPGSARIARIALDTGRVLETVVPDAPAVLLAGGSRTVLRILDGPRKPPARLVLLDRTGPVDGPEAGGFDVFNHPFPVRRASAAYALVGTDPGEPHRDKWVMAVSADGTPRRLFPHSWEPQEHHFGGPAAEIGPSLVYAGEVHDGQGIRPGGAYVVRRSLDGDVRWQYRTDHPATALDTDGETVYVAYNSGALVALDAEDGSVRWHRALEVGGAPTVALSLVLAPQGHLLVGTVDGRVLECEASPAGRRDPA
ncbi:PQQ-binding-like beta-propeller repeat protein [Streptomyces lavendulae]|uniref:outer membrane protein assembly factor BamB family protein n=1 Tax=Streptomyces lavendulae TaxID=1914 RepID=UPI0033EFB9DB